MAELFAFDRGTAARIAKTVKADERSAPLPPRTGEQPQAVTPKFWVELTAEGLGGEDDEEAGYYSWKLVYPTPTAWQDSSPLIIGTLNLREANGTTGLYTASPPSRYQAMFNGYDAENQPTYIFAGAAGGKIWAKITGATEIAPNRWKYNWTEQEYVIDGEWQDKPEGKTSGAHGFAYNGNEANNAATGILGNGIDTANIPAGYELQPARGSPVLELSPVVSCEDFSIEWIFNFENAVDGQCEEE